MKKHWFRFSLIVIIAFGLMLSPMFNLVYHCLGSEVLPVYYGSPFIHTRTNLGSSLEHFYSISGLALNTLIWIVIVTLVDKLLRKISKSKTYKLIYQILIGVLTVSAVFVIFWNATLIGQGFSENSNYWYWNVDEEAEKWGAECECEFKW